MILPLGASFTQDVPEDFQNKPVDVALLTGFMDKYGHKYYERIERENQKVITFRVSNEKRTQTVQFSIIFIPKEQLLKIEGHDLADVPISSEKRSSLLQRLNELNGTRTIGKYCIDKTNDKVRFFYYRTVVGGICFADFEKTLRIVEHIVFSDLEAIKDLRS